MLHLLLHGGDGRWGWSVHKKLNASRIQNAFLELLTRDQAFIAGLTSSQLWYRKHHGKLEEIVPGVFFGGPNPVTFETALHAVNYRVVQAGGALSHATAAHLHRLDGFTQRVLEGTVPRGLRSYATPLFHVHESDIPAAQRVSLYGLTVTSLPRTLIDLAPHLTHRQLVIAFEDLYRRDRRFRTELRNLVNELGNGRKLQPLMDLMNRRGDRGVATDSALEAICDDILWRHGYRTQRQVSIYDKRGRFIARVDFAFPGLRYYIEVDSREFHLNSRAFELDREKDARLQGAGWMGMRPAWTKLKQERLFMMEISAAIEQRALVIGQPPLTPMPNVQLGLGL